MKNIREQLISLLGLCSDNETEATRLQLLTSITQSADYSELSNSIALNKVFQDLYEYPKLEALNNSELKDRESLLHKIVSFNKQLIQSIHSGNSPELTNEDSPDFTSQKSITKLCNKIRLSHDITNYTNISEDNALDVFKDTTVKSAQECFDMLPISITKNDKIDETVIKEYMGDTLFCVNIEEFKTCHEKFLEIVEESEPIIKKEKLQKKKRMLIKIAVIMLCFGSIYACSQFGLFSDIFTSVFTFAMIAISILFLIWG